MIKTINRTYRFRIYPNASQNGVAHLAVHIIIEM